MQAVFVYEMFELFTLGAMYMKDSLNIAKASGLVLAVCALGYEKFSTSGDDEVQARNLMASGVLLLGVQQLRILYSVPSVGPLIFLVYEMFKDCLLYTSPSPRDS